MREYVRECLGIGHKMPIEDWPVADPEITEKYNANVPNTPGPREDQFELDWGTVGKTEWTRACIGIFARKFCREHEAGEFPRIQEHIVEVTNIEKWVSVYLVGLKRKYKKMAEDPELAQLLQEKANRRSRSTGRRIQVCLRLKVTVLNLNPSSCVIKGWQC
jgi:hypothetical protein